MSRLETYDLFWMSEALTDLAARQKELIKHYLASSAYVRYRDQLFYIKAITKGVFEEIKIAPENLEKLDNLLRVNELRDWRSSQQKSSARRALRLEEVVVLESILSGHSAFDELDERLSSTDGRESRPSTREMQIGSAERVYVAETIFQGGDTHIFTDPDLEKLKQPGGVARKIIESLQSKLEHRQIPGCIYVPLLAKSGRLEKTEMDELIKQLDILPDSSESPLLLGEIEEKNRDRVVKASSEDEKFMPREYQVRTDDVIDSFLQEKLSMLLLLGEPGAGKSRLLRELAKRKIEKVKECKNFVSSTDLWLPLFVELGSCSVESLKGIIPKLLKDDLGKYYDEAIEKLRKQDASEPNILIILDGWDELQNSEKIRLNDDTDFFIYCGGDVLPLGKIKILVTSRSAYFLDISKEHRLFDSKKHLYKQYELLPFSLKNIYYYIDHIQDEKEKVEFKKILKNPGLEQLIRNPLLLSFLIEAFPELAQSGNFKQDRQTLTRFQLYRALKNKRIKRDVDKSLSDEDVKKLTGQNNPEREVLYQTLSRFATYMAISLFNENTLELESHSGDKTWKRLTYQIADDREAKCLQAEQEAEETHQWFDEKQSQKTVSKCISDQIDLLLKKELMLKSRGRKYSFFHKSFYEYLIAEFILLLGDDAVVSNPLGYQLFIDTQQEGKNETIPKEIEQEIRDSGRDVVVLITRGEGIIARFTRHSKKGVQWVIGKEGSLLSIPIQLSSEEEQLTQKKGRFESGWVKFEDKEKNGSLNCFLDSILKKNLLHQLGDHLNHRLLSEEPEVFSFLHEAWKMGQEKACVEEILFEILKNSSEPSGEEIQMAAANAITMLNAVGASLIGKDLCGVRISGANLRYTILAHANLSKANLRGAALSGAMLYGADLSDADLTGTEWGELPSLEFKENTTKERKKLSNLEIKEPVLAVAFYPKSAHSWLAVGLMSGNIEIYNHQTSERVDTPLTGHTDKVFSLVFSSDGQTLASGSDDKTVCLWSLQRKTLNWSLKGQLGHESGVICMSFSSDGQTLTSMGNDGKLYRWSMEGEALGATIPLHKGMVMSLSLSPDSRVLAWGSLDKTVCLWSVSEEKALNEPLTGHTNNVTSIAFSPDSHTLASGGYDGIIRLWSVLNGKALGEPLTGHKIGVTSLSFSLDGQILASADVEGAVRLWLVPEGKALGAPLTGHTDGGVISMSFSPDGHTLASGGLDGMVHLWLVSKQAASSALLAGHAVESVSFSPDGQKLVSGGMDGIQLWSISKSGIQPLNDSLTRYKGFVKSVSFNPDGQMLASGGESGVSLFSALDGQTWSMFLAEEKDVVWSVSFNPSGYALASAGVNGVYLWWVLQGKALKGDRLTGTQNYASDVLFSPDGQNLAWWCNRGEKVHLRSMLNGQVFVLLTGHEEVLSVSFSPDSQVLASAGVDRVGRLWSVLEGKALGEPLIGHKGPINSISFSPDGQVLASGSYDRTVRLWAVSSGHCLTIFSWQFAIKTIAFQTRKIQWLDGISTRQDQEKVERNREIVVIKNMDAGYEMGFYDEAKKTYVQKTIPLEESTLLSKIEDKHIQGLQHAQLRQALFKLCMGWGASHLLAIGDSNGVVSFWLLSAELFFDSEKTTKSQPSNWRLLGSSRHSSMQLYPVGIQLAGCRMSRNTQRLFQQYGADEKELKRVKIIEITDEKSGVQPSQKPVLPLKESKTEPPPQTASLLSSSSSSTTSSSSTALSSSSTSASSTSTLSTSTRVLTTPAGPGVLSPPPSTSSAPTISRSPGVQLGYTLEGYRS